MRDLHLVGAVLLAASLAAFGQSTDQNGRPGPAKSKDTDHSAMITANVRQVLVPVVVTDKKGHYVTDLKASDFQVFENGVPQQIVAFSSAPDSLPLGVNGTIAAQPGKTAVSAVIQKSSDSSPLQRSYLICVDTLHSSFANFTRVRNALRKFFEQEPSGDSQYALVALGRDITMLRDSTRNPSEIVAATEDKRILKAIQRGEAGNTAVAMQQFPRLVKAYCGLCGCPTFPQELVGCSGARANIQLFLQNFGERMEVMDQRFFAGLEQLVAAIASMPTTRTIVLISDGFNRTPGNELYAILQGFGARDPAFNLKANDTQGVLDKILRLAVQNNVQFYTLDSRGLYTLASIDGSSLDASTGGISPKEVDHNEMSTAHENTDGLAELANQTGGLFFENSNDLVKAIRTAVVDGQERYVLAYVPSDTTMDGKYRKIRVEVNDRKLRVRAKPGYWASN